jgi:hypothetical protein
MMVKIRSSESLVLTVATRRNIPEDSILRSHRRENLKSYIGSTVFHIDTGWVCAVRFMPRMLEPVEVAQGTNWRRSGLDGKGKNLPLAENLTQAVQEIA